MVPPAKASVAPSEKFSPLPWQRPYLEAGLNPDIRFVTACIGRRAGKTYSTVQLIKKRIKQKKGKKPFLVWWVAPTNHQATIGLDVFLEICPPGSAEYTRIVKQVRFTDPKRIEFHNNSRIEFKSADKADSLRGKGCDLLIVDEAAFIKDEVWYRYLYPTLADKGGDAVFISTPAQKNWFYDYWLRGKDPSEPLYASFHGTTLDNLASPGVQEFVQEVERTSPGPIFRQEILAEFLEEDSDVFRGIKDFVYQAQGVSDYNQFLEEREGVYLGEPYKNTDQYVIGVDVAKLRDWTVVTVVKIDRKGEDLLKKVVYLDRFRGDDFAVQKQRVHKAWKQYGMPKLVVDASGKGDAFIEELRRGPQSIPEHLIRPYVFTTWSKKTLIQSLQADIDHGRVSYPRIKVLLDELAAYQYVLLPSGEPRYSAPGKKNDDCVISLALACVDAAKEEQPIFVGAYSAAILGF